MPGCCAAVQTARASRASFLLPPTNGRTIFAGSSRTSWPSSRIPCPMLGPAARLHRHQAERAVGEVLEELRPCQSQVDDLTRFRVHPVELKHPLRRIDANDRSASLHLGPSGLPVKSLLFHLGTLMPSAREGPTQPSRLRTSGVGGVHSISPSPSCQLSGTAGRPSHGPSIRRPAHGRASPLGGVRARRRTAALLGRAAGSGDRPMHVAGISGRCPSTIGMHPATGFR